MMANSSYSVFSFSTSSLSTGKQKISSSIPEASTLRPILSSCSTSSVSPSSFSPVTLASQQANTQRKVQTFFEKVLQNLSLTNLLEIDSDDKNKVPYRENIYWQYYTGYKIKNIQGKKILLIPKTAERIIRAFGRVFYPILLSPLILVLQVFWFMLTRRFFSLIPASFSNAKNAAHPLHELIFFDKKSLDFTKISSKFSALQQECEQLSLKEQRAIKGLLQSHLLRYYGSVENEDQTGPWKSLTTKLWNALQERKISPEELYKTLDLLYDLYQKTHFSQKTSSFHASYQKGILATLEAVNNEPSFSFQNLVSEGTKWKNLYERLEAFLKLSLEQKQDLLSTELQKLLGSTEITFLPEEIYQKIDALPKAKKTFIHDYFRGAVAPFTITMSTMSDEITWTFHPTQIRKESSYAAYFERTQSSEKTAYLLPSGDAGDRTKTQEALNKLTHDLIEHFQSAHPESTRSEQETFAASILMSLSQTIWASGQMQNKAILQHIIPDLIRFLIQEAKSCPSLSDGQILLSLFENENAILESNKGRKMAFPKVSRHCKITLTKDQAEVRAENFTNASCYLKHGGKFFRIYPKSLTLDWKKRAPVIFSRAVETLPEALPVTSSSSSSSS